MTQRDIDREILGASAGRVMRRLGRSTFRIVIVLGPARRNDKLRVCVWSDNSRRWSNPQTCKPEDLAELAPMAELTAGQRRVIQHAILHANNPAPVTPWTHKTAPRKVPAAGVTKLAPVTGEVAKNGDVKFSDTAEGRTKLQRLNNELSNWMFGGGRKR